ncbi:ditrans,polycis-polyprenyl diphosphate synthase ((2e,6e)-farnesyl diphosphate specific) [Plakobranchus ocellatus]|uniref:Alkyl transferase n=1 Tax=Plakobranchus ocellatus TaxID=259542 RepID=A0AAV3YEC1_9GAST|nr:ditrans,polycis-polyprenyl diphosphate synthase ((2e,6e)-farnesyl diphosphate specific) [Plakobranchus ocellatus]
MTWFPERRQPTWLQRFCEAVLKSGPVPRHVAIIMDGNRRFAVKNSMEKCEGHVKGFDKLAETLEWCLDLGITEVTVYAFSIENFKRSPDEVNGLLELSRQKFAKLLEERNLIQEHGVCVRILGDIALLPRDLQELLAEAVTISANNDRAILNVCFAYTSRDDMCHAMREMTDGVKEGFIRESDISEGLLEKCLYTSHSRHVDLLIRTSGEVRLSDFLLWESAYSCLAFVKVLWPEFSIWNLYAAILHYQRNYGKIQIARQNFMIERERLQRESDHRYMLEEEAGICSKPGSPVDTKTSVLATNCVLPQNKNAQTLVQQYAKARKEREDTFLAHVYRKRADFLKSLLPTRPILMGTPSEALIAS